jgi:hypothetical protein
VLNVQASQHEDDAIPGGETEVAKDPVIGVKDICRNLAQVIEDARTDQGVYFIGKPGQGVQTVDFDLRGGGPYTVPKATRTFKGIEIDVRKGFSNNWALIGSYLNSKPEGDYDGSFQESTGHLDPDNNSAYDDAEFQIHNGYNGENRPLTNDRRHQLKVSASYLFPFGLTVGRSAYWQSGIPITAYDYSAAYQNWESYLSDRGAFGTTPSVFEADLHLAYPFSFSGVQVAVLMDVFNLLNRPGGTNRNMQYDLVENGEVIKYDTGQTLPPTKPGDTTRPPTKPAFNHANAWRAPRTIRLGVRLTFQPAATSNTLGAFGPLLFSLRFFSRNARPVVQLYLHLFLTIGTPYSWF